MDNEQAYLNTHMAMLDKEVETIWDLPEESTLPGEDYELEKE